MGKLIYGKHWSEREVELLQSLAAKYTCRAIGEKLNRTERAVRGKLKRIKRTKTEIKRTLGISPTEFSAYTGIHIRTIHHLIRVKKLPVLEFSKTTKFEKNNTASILIDESKIKDWLMKGYVYHRDMKPTSPYIKMLVTEVRRELDILWISKKDVIECLRKPHTTIENWQCRNGFPQLCCNLYQMSITMFNRNDVIEWVLKNPNKVSQHRVLELRYTGIGRGFEV